MNAAKEIREKLGKTQREVARDIDATERSIARIEAGEISSGRVAIDLARYYGVSTDALLGRKD